MAAPKARPAHPTPRPLTENQPQRGIPFEPQAVLGRTFDRCNPSLACGATFGHALQWQRCQTPPMRIHSTAQSAQIGKARSNFGEPLTSRQMGLQQLGTPPEPLEAAAIANAMPVRRAHWYGQDNGSDYRRNQPPVRPRLRHPYWFQTLLQVLSCVPSQNAQSPARGLVFDSIQQLANARHFYSALAT